MFKKAIFILFVIFSLMLVIGNVTGDDISSFDAKKISTDIKINDNYSTNTGFDTGIYNKVIGKSDIANYVLGSIEDIRKNTLGDNSTSQQNVWDGTVLHNTPTQVYYSNPSNDYERSVNYLSNYVPVYEGYAGGEYILGMTYYENFTASYVVIAYRDPFVVYHELGHVVHPEWSEYQCDLFAYQYTGYSLR